MPISIHLKQCSWFNTLNERGRQSSSQQKKQEQDDFCYWATVVSRCVNLNLQRHHNSSDVESMNSQRFQCPCWGWPAAGVGAEWEGSWTSPPACTHRGPGGTAQEGSWTSLSRRKHKPPGVNSSFKNHTLQTGLHYNNYWLENVSVQMVARFSAVKKKQVTGCQKKKEERKTDFHLTYRSTSASQP